MIRGKNIWIAILIGFASCSTEVKQKETIRAPEKQPKVIEKERPLKVVGDDFLGIQPNDPIADHSKSLQKGKVRDGEKVLEVYNIEVKGNELGYLLHHSEDNSLVGNIVLQSDKIETDEGVRVGMLFAELKEKYANITTEASDRSGEFFASTADFRFRLRQKKVNEKDRKKARVSEIILLEK